MLAMQNMPESQKNKKKQNKKNPTNKQTKKKSVTGTLGSINKKLVSCSADLWVLKGVRHFEGIR